MYGRAGDDPKPGRGQRSMEADERFRSERRAIATHQSRPSRARLYNKADGQKSAPPAWASVAGNRPRLAVNVVCHGRDRHAGREAAIAMLRGDGVSGTVGADK